MVNVAVNIFYGQQIKVLVFIRETVSNQGKIS